MDFPGPGPSENLRAFFQGVAGGQNVVHQEDPLPANRPRIPEFECILYVFLSLGLFQARLGLCVPHSSEIPGA